MTEMTELVRINSKLIDQLENTIGKEIEKKYKIKVPRSQLVQSAIMQQLNPFKNLIVTKTKQKLTIKYEKG